MAGVHYPYSPLIHIRGVHYPYSPLIHIRAAIEPRSLDIWRPHNAIKLKPGCVANEHQVCTSYAKHPDPYGVLNKSRAVNLAQYSMFFCFEAVTPLNIFCSIPHLNSDAKFSILLE